MKNLLVISPEYPFPPRCGFTVRVGDLCRHLAKAMEIDLFACRRLDDPDALPERNIFRQVFATAGASAGLPPPQGSLDRLARRLSPPHFDDPAYLPAAILGQLADLQAHARYHACIVQTPLLCRCLPAIRPDTLRIVDAHDIWHQKYLGFRALGCGRLLAQHRDPEREMAFYRSADHVLAISLWDHALLRSHCVNSIYTPVAFSPEPLPPRAPPGHDLLMASGSGPFNMDAIHFFIAEILPLVLKEIPDVRLKIASPAPEITKEYSEHPQVILLPFLDHPHDLYAQADLAIAPLRFTSGLKIKVLEAFSFGKPIILSPAAAQGIPVVNYAQRVVSSKPQEFAAEIVAALRDPACRQALAAAGLNLIETAYSPDQAYGELMAKL